jgi:hypothetical protein
MEEWIDADTGIIVSRAIADGNLINAVTSPDSESKTPESESTDEEMVTEKISWAEATNAYSTLLQLTKRRPCY